MVAVPRCRPERAFVDLLVRAMGRLGLPAAALALYDEHVEADAVHEQLVRRGVIALLRCGTARRSALRRPLADGPDAAISVGAVS